MAVIVETLMAQDLELGVGLASKTHPAGGTLNGHQISLSTLSTVGASGVANSKAWDLSTVGIDINGYVTTTIEVPGAALGDMVLVSLDTLSTSACLVSAHVSDLNTVTVVLYNPTTAKVYPASGTLRALVFKYRQ
jgi:hypothetical protein